MISNNQFQQSNGGFNSMPVEQRARNKKPLIVVLGIIIVLCALFAVFIFSQGGSSELEDKAAAAAREAIPNAEAEKVVVADGFAMAIIYVPGDDTQLGSGNTSIFRVNEDESMTYLASASYFSPVDLLEFGIPLETQAKLREIDLNNVKQELASYCSYGYYDTPGYSGFEGSFKPDGWEIDSASLAAIVESLNSVIVPNNADKESDNKIICINAEVEGSDVRVDETSFASTFILSLKFITGGGNISDHVFTFTDGQIYSRIYTLDGEII